jgi:hypothetical protein
MAWDAFDARGIAIFFHSDDAGKTWQESSDWWALPVRCRSGLQEPGVIELARGRLLAYCRTATGRQWHMSSRDHGTSWTPPQPGRFRSPCSPLSMKRIPKTGDILAVWNDHRTRRRPKQAEGGASRGRTPLVTAISRDETRSWQAAKRLEKDAARGFCYTAIHFTDDAALLAYCCGGRGCGVLQRTCVKRVPYTWLYDRSSNP